ncbi:hypothetical protein F3Y22_tig00111059pilonHSYRG00129 [Hibiscus syriacus]|uniref:CCHC-type domain-containing protein n=1 Tax=Hibiscus syriacus TaxID=106335 RepID=A0A6A2Z3H3_HIBSY|nr:hypothetical protein F3Y22_tig00111059pilonHSYRG00129 [Hibiscus syriacus]
METLGKQDPPSPPSDGTIEDRQSKKARQHNDEPPDKSSNKIGLIDVVMHSADPNPVNPVAPPISYSDTLMGASRMEQPQDEFLLDGDEIEILDGDVTCESVDGLISIVFSDHVQALVEKCFAQTFVVKLLVASAIRLFEARSLNFRSPHKRSVSWTLRIIISFVTFSSHIDYLQDLFDGHWTIFGHYLNVEPWSSNFLVSPARPTKVVAWICLSDYQIESGRRGRFARMAFRVDLKKPLISTILVNGRVQLVEYESLPTICFSCGIYSHAQDNCTNAVSSDKLDTHPLLAMKQHLIILDDLFGNNSNPKIATVIADYDMDQELLQQSAAMTLMQLDHTDLCGPLTVALNDTVSVPGMETEGCGNPRSFMAIQQYLRDYSPDVVGFLEPISNASKRKLLWRHLRYLASIISSPWILLGDFNATLFVFYMKDCARSSGPYKDFQEFLFDLDLRGMGFQGPQFTWLCGSALVRLDRVRYNSTYDKLFRMLLSYTSCSSGRIIELSSLILATLISPGFLAVIGAMMKIYSAMRSSFTLNSSLFRAIFPMELILVLGVFPISRQRHHIHNAVSTGNCKPFRLVHNGSPVSHLLFVDDLILNAQADPTQAKLNDSILTESGVFFSHKDVYWVILLRQKYKVLSCFPLSISRLACSTLWHGLSNVWELLRSNIAWSLGNGGTIRLWDDVWVPALDESILYVLRDCPTVCGLWHKLLCTDQHDFFSSDLRQWMLDNLRARTTLPTTNIPWNILFLTLLWQLWKRGNEFVFSDVCWPLNELLHCSIVWVRHFVKSGSPGIPRPRALSVELFAHMMVHEFSAFARILGFHSSFTQSCGESSMACKRFGLWD